MSSLIPPLDVVDVALYQERAEEYRMLCFEFRMEVGRGLLKRQASCGHHHASQYVEVRLEWFSDSPFEAYDAF